MEEYSILTTLLDDSIDKIKSGCKVMSIPVLYKRSMVRGGSLPVAELTSAKSKAIQTQSIAQKQKEFIHANGVSEPHA